MTRLLPFALLSAFALAPAPDVTATWNLTGDVQGYPIAETCVLTQTEMKIAGTCKDTLASRAVTGTVTEKSVSFSHPSEYEGQALVLTYTGNLDDAGKLSGTIDVAPLGYSGVFSATKATVTVVKP